MQVQRQKRKVSRRTITENPNQLSFEFTIQESEIELHRPKQKIKLDTSVRATSKRAMITLSVG